MSEGPSGGAAGLLGGDRVGILGHELVDVPRRRAGAGGAVLVGEAAVGHGRCPAALGEHLGEALQRCVVGDTGRLGPRAPRRSRGWRRRRRSAGRARCCGSCATADCRRSSSGRRPRRRRRRSCGVGRRRRSSTTRTCGGRVHRCPVPGSGWSRASGAHPPSRVGRGRRGRRDSSLGVREQPCQVPTIDGGRTHRAKHGKLSWRCCGTGCSMKPCQTPRER